MYILAKLPHGAIIGKLLGKYVNDLSKSEQGKLYIALVLCPIAAGVCFYAIGEMMGAKSKSSEEKETRCGWMLGVAACDFILTFIDNDLSPLIEIVFIGWLFCKVYKMPTGRAILATISWTFAACIATAIIGNILWP